ncbi:sensor histidine kinase [Paractinoplanes maris]|uniref:sensor histidine kinase n=1 Tax=Paractinoplanes maris TaxID=1734446 RepID=UPI0020208FBB|nr:HAMP domain-containing sensor histidine kinase [Actinoplanes maris]
MTRVPPHRSLVARLLGLSLVVMLCAVTATAWLAAQSTRATVQAQYNGISDGEEMIYDEVVAYAATHTDWSAVRPLLVELAARTGRPISLSDPDGEFLAGSETSTVRPARRSALVDPLYLEGYLSPDPAGRGIDWRAVGPYRLTEAELATVSARALAAESCLLDKGLDAWVSRETGGRPTLNSDDASDAQLAGCARETGADVPTATEQRALDALTTLTNACLGDGTVTVLLGFTWTGAPAGSDPRTCIDDALRMQLRPYVAPRAILHIHDAASVTGPVFDLSRASTLRIAGVSALVLAVAVAITLVVGVRMSRPLRALTRAAEQGAARLPIRGRDEIGRLTTAFNDLTERREAGERQRQAMVNDIAHELGTPLTNIRAWLQAARDGVADPGPELLDLLVDEADVLQHIIDDLRDLAAADAGRLRLHPELVYVNEVLDQVAAVHRSRSSDVTIVTEPAGDPEVMLDPLRIRQAVGNLLSNAVRHSPPGATVTVRSRLDGEDLVIEVVDTGDGISEDDLPHVFTRFWRADRSRSRHTGGSGLGLAIVRDLVGAHGGTVTVTSRAGHGSTFTIRLPARA